MASSKQSLAWADSSTITIAEPRDTVCRQSANGLCCLEIRLAAPSEKKVRGHIEGREVLPKRRSGSHRLHPTAIGRVLESPPLGTHRP